MVADLRVRPVAARHRARDRARGAVSQLASRAGARRADWPAAIRGWRSGGGPGAAADRVRAGGADSGRALPRGAAAAQRRGGTRSKTCSRTGATR